MKTDHIKECVEELKTKFSEKLQYFEMVTLVKLFIEAERTGNWNVHLQVVYQCSRTSMLANIFCLF